MNEIFKRQSIRNYTDEPVSKEDIELLMKAAMQAPSAVNQQPWEFYVITDKELLAKLAEASPYAKPIGRAPLGIVLAYKKDVIVPALAPIDLALSTENIMLEAVALGLGSVMLGIYPDPNRMNDVKALLNMPENLEPLAMLAVGHPAESRPVQDRFDPERIHYIS